MKRQIKFAVAAFCALVIGFWACTKTKISQQVPPETPQTVAVKLKTQSMTFVHPGIQHTKADLNRMKANLAVEPWKTAYNAFKAKSTASLTYTMQGPYTTVQRDPTAGNIGNSQLENDSQAVWDQSIMWYLTGNTTYRDKAITILNAWSSTLTNITGTDAQLAAGDNGIRFANGAEIIRYTSTTWAAADITQCEQMFLNVFYPQVASPGDANWGGSAMKSMIAMAVFRSDETMFNNAISNFNTNTCASLAADIAPSGQNSESGRDQPHSLGGTGNLAVVANIAYNQGTDLFASLSNRILAGMEYWCKYNLGNTVPYDPAFHRCTMGPWSGINGTGGGILQWANAEMMYAYYGVIKGVETPYNSQFINAQAFSDNTLFYRRAVSGTTPYIPAIEAENYNGMSGVALETCSEGGQDVGNVNNNDYIVFNNVNLNASTTIDARVASNSAGGTIEVRSGSLTGTLLATITVTSTGGWQTWTTKSATITNPGAGLRSIYLVFQNTSGSYICNLNWIKFR